MLRRVGIIFVAGVLGAGSALGAAACGDERGDVKFEGDTGGTGTGGTATGETSTERTTTEP